MPTLNTNELGKVALLLPRVDSTNDALLRMLAENEPPPHGLWLRAKHQFAGRGQGGRSWQVEPGANLTGSMLLRPEHLRAGEVFRLSQVASLAMLSVCRLLLERHSVDAGSLSIKWPNDILFGHRKMAGILIQTSLQGDRVSWAILGIGLNVNQLKFSSDLNRPACSLAQIIGRHIDLETLEAQLLNSLKHYYQLSDARGHSQLNETYRQQLYRLNQKCSYRHAATGHRFSGTIRGTDSWGRLLLEGPAGLLQAYDPKTIQYL